MPPWPNTRRRSEFYPDSADLRNSLGSALEQQGRIEDAIAQFKDAIQIDPKLADAHNNLGHGAAIARKSADQQTTAEQEFKTAIALKPEFRGCGKQSRHALWPARERCRGGTNVSRGNQKQFCISASPGESGSNPCERITLFRGRYSVATGPAHRSRELKMRSNSRRC